MRYGLAGVLAVAACGAPSPCRRCSPRVIRGPRRWSVPLEDDLLRRAGVRQRQGPVPVRGRYRRDGLGRHQARLPGRGLQLADDRAARSTTRPINNRKRSYADVLGLELGTLTLERLTGEVVADHVYDSDGRTIDGLIGRDVIADSLGFDVRSRPRHDLAPDREDRSRARPRRSPRRRSSSRRSPRTSQRGDPPVAKARDRDDRRYARARAPSISARR